MPLDLVPFRAYLAVERGLASATIEAYCRELEGLEREDLADLDAATLRTALHFRAGAPATVARRLAAWRSYFRWLERTGYREDDPTKFLSRPKVRPGLPKPVDDLDALLDRLDPVMQAVTVFLAETGLRISEACSVAEQVPVPDELIVLGKGSKERFVPLTDLARAALDELGGSIPLAKRTVQRRLQLSGATPHRLRHSFATNLAEADVDTVLIQRLLGHASAQTTQVYAEISRRRLREAVTR